MLTFPFFVKLSLDIFPIFSTNKNEAD